MAATLKHVFRFSKNLSKYGVFRVSYSPRIVQGSIYRAFSTDSNDAGDTKKSQLNLAKPKNRLKDRQERHLEAERAKEIGLDSDLIKAAESVAESLGGDVEKTQSDLLQQLKAHAAKSDSDSAEPEPEKAAKPVNSMSDLLSSMKFVRPGPRRRGAVGRGRSKDASSSSSSDDEDRPSVRDRFADNRMQQRDFQQGRVERAKSIEEILKGARLNIFNTDEDAKEAKEIAVAEAPSNPLFDEADRTDYIRLSAAPPANAFEEMILWTKEGKLWQFPIDNEQGWEEEKNIGFHEHVFLEQHLVGFPQTPAIQHFMELVTTGLSLNPYLTVQMKIDHINWFKEYINSKMHLMEEEKPAIESQS